jgi:hypothetical protein
MDCGKFDLDLGDGFEPVLSRLEHRVHHLKRLVDMTVTTPLRYLDADFKTKDLPVSVEELLTSGLELVKKSYRVKVLTHFGHVIAYVDIAGDDELKNILGSEHVSKLDAKDFDASEIFSLVVCEKLVLRHTPPAESVADRVPSLRDRLGGFQLHFTVEEGKAPALATNQSTTHTERVQRTLNHTLIIHTKVFEAIGRLFKCVVLFEGPNLDIFYHYHDFFSRRRFSRDRLDELGVVFKLIDVRSKQTATLRQGLSAIPWVLDAYFKNERRDLNLAKPSRHIAFVEYLWSYVRILYNEDRLFVMQFIDPE